MLRFAALSSLGTLFFADRANASVAPSFGAHDVTSVFYVSKSENKNQVHYGVHLDADCKIDGTAPIYPYWQIREGAARVESLLPREESAYGILSQVVSGSSIRLTLRALANHVIVIQILPRSALHAGETGCLATPAIVIGQVTARLDHVFIQLSWPFGVSYLQLVGKSDAGNIVEERISKS